PGSGEGQCTIGTLASPFEGSFYPDGAPAPPSFAPPGRYHCGTAPFSAAAAAGVDNAGANPAAATAAALLPLRSGATINDSLDASFSLCVRGGRAAGGGGGGGGGGGRLRFAAESDISPQICVFEPFGGGFLQNGYQQQNDVDGIRASYASYGSVNAGGAAHSDAVNASSLTPGGGGNGSGGVHRGLLGACDGGGTGGGGLQLTVQLLELRYAMQKVEQAAGELAAVLMVAGKGRAAAYNSTNIYATPIKTSSTGSAAAAAAAAGGSRLATGSRQPLASRLMADSAAEAVLQERAWLADSLIHLTGRASAVAEQLDSCLDAAVSSKGAAGIGSGAAVSGMVSGPGETPRDTHVAAVSGQLSSLAVRVLEGELADLKRDFEEAQRQADQVLELQRAQHVEECTALAADAHQYRELAQRLREQLAALGRARHMEGILRREQDEEARLQSESQHHFVVHLEHRVLEQEAVISQLRRQLDLAVHAPASRRQHDRERDRFDNNMSNVTYGSHGGQRSTSGVTHSHSCGGGGGGGGECHHPQPSFGGQRVSGGADRPVDGEVAGPAASSRSGQSRYSEQHHVSSFSIGDTCPSEGGGGGGTNSIGSCGSCHVSGGGGGGYRQSASDVKYGPSGAAAGGPGALAAGRPPHSTHSHRDGVTVTRTPNSADARTMHVDLLNANDHFYHNHNDSQRHSRGGVFSTTTTASPPPPPGQEADGAAEYGRRSCGGGGGGGAEPLSEDEARLWMEMLQLLKASENGGSGGGGANSRGSSGGSSSRYLTDNGSAGAAAPLPPPPLALTAAGESDSAASAGGDGGGGGSGMQLVQAPYSARSTATTTDMPLVAAAAAGSTQGRAEMLARAVSHISLLSAQNRKLAKLLKGVAAAAAVAAPSQGMDGLAARYDAAQKENVDLREKYKAAQLAQKRSEQAMRKLGLENRQLHSQVLELIGAQTVAIRARSASAGGDVATDLMG
ncbi:hypothetical protein VaNZ11_016913, partial [Volvox africanus]